MTTEIYGVSGRRWGPAIDTALFWGWSGLLMFGPLAFGAVQSWSFFVYQLGAITLLGLWAVRQSLSGNIHVSSSPLFLPAALFGVLVLLQLSAGLSAYRYMTHAAALEYGLYAIMMFLATQILRLPERRMLLMQILVFFAAAISAFALVYAVAGNGKLYWFYPVSEGSKMFGPYVNRNHFAGLMEMLLPMALVLSFSKRVHPVTRATYLLCVFLIAAAVTMSKSRAGVLIVGMELLVIVLMVLPKGTKNSRLALRSLAVLGVIVFVAAGVASNFMAKFHSDDLIRIGTTMDSLKMFKAHPFAGWGLGTFPYVYPQYRSYFSWYFINHAHNDYAELLVETGAAGIALMLWFLSVVFTQGWSRCSGWRSQEEPAFQLAGLLGIAGLLVHSLVDYNLHIPANAVFLFALCAVVAMYPSGASQRRSKSAHRRERMQVVSIGD